MKTLDEVIDIMEHPLYGADDGFAEVAEDDLADALHYLREYQAEKANLEIIKGNYQDAIANCEKAENKFKTALKKLDIGTLNDPLDWDELRAMEGKPVWFEVTDPKALPALDSGWGIVGCTSFSTWEGVGSFSLVKVGVTYAVPIAQYGRAWNVYRKERT